MMDKGLSGKLYFMQSGLVLCLPLKIVHVFVNCNKKQLL